MRVALERHGASFRGQPEVFATAAAPGVHFTDVFEDADGSLLIIDTGGWFTHGCSSAGPIRPDIFGGIYRVRRKGAPRVEDPRGLAIAWSQLSSAKLIDFLADPRPAVRDRALFEVAKPGPAGVSALAAALRDDRYLIRSNALWALTRIATPAARAAVRLALVDSNSRVRQAACHSVFMTTDGNAADRLIAMLTDEAPAVRREAARALGRLRGERAIPALADAAAATASDPFLMHALIYALIEIAQPAEMRKLLAHPHPLGRRAALIALDQMGKGELAAGAVFDALRSSDAALHTVALEIALRHPDWGVEAADYLASVYSAVGTETARKTTGPRLLASFLRFAAAKRLFPARARA